MLVQQGVLKISVFLMDFVYGRMIFAKMLVLLGQVKIVQRKRFANGILQ